jgi:hypothetical protein
MLIIMMFNKCYALTTGPTLRMAFHDCGTWQRYPKPAFDKNPQCGGCNGSFKKEFEDGKSTNFCTFPQQNGEHIFIYTTKTHTRASTYNQSVLLAAHCALSFALVISHVHTM